MAEKYCNAHVALKSFRLFLKQNFVLFPIFATNNSFTAASRTWSILVKIYIIF